MEKIAVYTGSKNLYENMVTAAKSLTANSDVDKIYFLIEDDIFPFDLPNHIEIMNMSKQNYFIDASPNMKTHFTYFALLRAALPLIFPQYDRILSLDVDTIAVRKCSDVWNLELQNRYFTAAPEWRKSKEGLRYTNAGVTLFNLKKLRDTGKVDEVIDVLNRRQYIFVDQDVLNYLCQGNIGEMPSEYNANEFTWPCTNPRIVHFAGIHYEKWNNKPQVAKYRNMSWNDVFVERRQLEYRS